MIDRGEQREFMGDSEDWPSDAMDIEKWIPAISKGEMVQGRPRGFRGDGKVRS